jgi:hypothetical protein
MMRRYLIIAMVAVLATLWTGSAAAIPPERFVTFEATSVFKSPFCGDATIVEHDVGRITLKAFFNPDGTLKAFTIQDAATTSTLTNTETGATLTFFYSNFVNDQYRVDHRTGAITDTLSFNGLNAIIRSPEGPPIVTAGRAALTYLVTFDVDGNPIFTPTRETATPNMEHLTKILCA